MNLETGQYTVGLVCPLAIELTAVRLMLDRLHPAPRDLNTERDDNIYTFGSINDHAVVIASLPMGSANSLSAAHLINPMSTSFPRLRVTFLVGIGGGIPAENAKPDSDNDIRLGDVVVGCVTNTKQAVIDVSGRGILPQPDRRILNVLTKVISNRDLGNIQFSTDLSRCTEHSSNKFKYPGWTNDTLYEATYKHVSRSEQCDECASDHIVYRGLRTNDEPRLHFGVIACVERVIRDAARRDTYREQFQAICVEMEAAGILGRKNCLVIRGISDYADSHKNDTWKGYAAATAAATMREILYTMDAGVVGELEPISVALTKVTQRDASARQIQNSDMRTTPPTTSLLVQDKALYTSAQRLVSNASETRRMANGSEGIEDAISKFRKAIDRLQPTYPIDVLLAHARLGLVECFIDLADKTNDRADDRCKRVKEGKNELHHAEELLLLLEGKFPNLQCRGDIYSAVLDAQKVIITANRNTKAKREAGVTLAEALDHMNGGSPPNKQYADIVQKYLDMLK